MERNIDDELLEMWNRVTGAAESTRTKIKKVVEPIIEPLEVRTAKVEKKVTSIGKAIRESLKKLVGDVETHVLDK